MTAPPATVAQVPSTSPDVNTEDRADRVPVEQEEASLTEMVLCESQLPTLAEIKHSRVPSEESSAFTEAMQGEMLKDNQSPAIDMSAEPSDATPQSVVQEADNPELWRLLKSPEGQQEEEEDEEKEASLKETVLCESRLPPLAEIKLSRVPSEESSAFTEAMQGEMLKDDQLRTNENSPAIDASAEPSDATPQTEQTVRAAGGLKPPDMETPAEMDTMAIPPGRPSSSASSTPTRKISFRAETLFQSAVQEADNPELWRLLESPEGQQLNINEANHAGLTALHQCVLNANLDGVKMLLCRGADVNRADVNGYTPLHTAAACDLLQVASLLMTFGADLFALTHDSDLPIDLTKDPRLARVMSNEMLHKLQQRTYWRGILMHYLKELLRWSLLSLGWLVSSGIQLIRRLLSSAKQTGAAGLPKTRRLGVHEPPTDVKDTKLD